MKSQSSRHPTLTPLAQLLATSLAALALPALAQTAEAPDAAKADVASLDRVVTTATSSVKSKMRSSVTVTDIDQDQIKDFGPRTEAEVLLLIPGIRTDATAGAGGNANISVRGLPIASGGSKYVQLQEDGLPGVQFGDMNFSNNDYWIRFDNNIDSIQTLRGGSSSVFASQAPGAVINYISKTGKEKGGSLALSRGLNYNETRVDADYGDRLDKGLYYHIGGYYREGEGSHRSTPNALQGYQLKGNITKEFNDGKGYVRAYFKVLDEHAPANPQTFISATQNGNSIGGFAKLPGYDATRESGVSIYNASVPGIDPVTHQLTNTSLTDGITVNSKSVGLEFHNALDNGFTIDDKFRRSQNSGAFQTQFLNVMTLANMLSGFGAGTTVKYYNGPNTGQAVTASNLQLGLVSQGAAINTQTPDMGNLVNDLSVNKQFKLDLGTIDLKGGIFHSRQNVVQRWAISERLVEVGKNGAVIDAYDSTGAALTTAGLTGYNNQWGGCCARDIDAHFTTNAPYLSMNLQRGDLDVDAGVRRENFSSNASYAAGTSRAVDLNGDGQITGAEKNVFLIDATTPRGLSNYKVSYTNYSAGVNYRLTPDLSVFARTSKGNRAIADRLLFSANIDAKTGLLANRDAALAPVRQNEIGARYRGHTEHLNYGVSATLFHSTTQEFDYDQTRQDNPALPNYQGPKLNVVGYKADGLELETAGAIGDFALNVNLVYSDEKITTNLGAPAFIGKTESGLPKLRYTISPRYTFGPATFGATIRGQDSVWADGGNTIRIGGHYVVSAFVNYDFGKGLTGALNVNNLFDKVYPAGGGGFVPGSTTVFGAGVENGRTINASLRYAF
ncbi:TonB-dependent siderophore receptor [Roseateles saccharophilus]|uniref:Outer membrane receptor protein involved in Fe transport n=1 Tax=Roseateles saccharophilus TaxID=304 RepID=A0A4V2VSF8_ROSSA|nr:TonB-dependent receptor [Roseateles saccharophilus]MDG0835378.1 TonB-dependent receptor [Roseateles saccharophilus]TCV02240.1 outer membrane receptor protein involved in Fe transport [Roseateles saccharophilus]